jgi:hypothetical protein
MERVVKEMKNIFNSQEQQLAQIWIFEEKRNYEASTMQLLYLRYYTTVAKQT